MDPRHRSWLSCSWGLDSVPDLMTLPIPDFDIHGVLPPIRPGSSGGSPARSPYESDMLGLCKRFGTSAERRLLLGGLLQLRSRLSALGLSGFQWVDGSFTEDVEQHRERPPRDIDVVTFVPLGTPEEQRSLLAKAPDLFKSEAKAAYSVDHYLMPSDRPFNDAQARRIAYWYSMWSHQRDTNRWKGFVSVLLPDSDDAAQQWLTSQGASI